VVDVLVRRPGRNGFAEQVVLMALAAKSILSICEAVNPGLAVSRGTKTLKATSPGIFLEYVRRFIGDAAPAPLLTLARRLVREGAACGKGWRKRCGLQKFTRDVT